MADGISFPTVPWQMITVNTKMERLEGCLKSPEKTSASDANNPQLQKACAELESLFIYYLFKEMRATVPKTGFLSGGKAEETYTSMLDMELAKELSSKGGMGLSSILVNQLDKETISAEKKASIKPE